MSKQMRISRQVLNSKRHVQGYVVGGKRMTVAQTRKLASKGMIENVRVVGRHVQAIPGTRPLSSLQYTII